MDINQDQVPPLQHHHDKHVMDKIITTNALTNNNCRLFLQTITIADLCTAVYEA
jgi:hypothetical protein